VLQVELEHALEQPRPPDASEPDLGDRDGRWLQPWWPVAGAPSIDFVATLPTAQPPPSTTALEQADRNAECQYPVWGGRSTFSEADIQIQGLQWNRMYFGNAAFAGTRQRQLSGC
jgi:hypothetical protein